MKQCDKTILGYFGGGVLLLIFSGVMLSQHIAKIDTVRTVSVPLVAALPALERKVHILEQQVELTELHEVTRLSSNEEKIEVFALPDDTDISRIIATFDIVQTLLKRDGYLSEVTSIQVSPAKDEVSLSVTVHEQGLRTLLLLAKLSGLLTIADVLTEQELQSLVSLTEQENPSGLIALEQFVSADLLRYVQDPKTYEEQLKRSFASATFLEGFDAVLRTSVLQEAKLLLRSGIAKQLQDAELWPIQMMAVQEISQTAGAASQWYKVGLTLEVFTTDS